MRTNSYFHGVSVLVALIAAASIGVAGGVHRTGPLMAGQTNHAGVKSGITPPIVPLTPERKAKILIDKHVKSASKGAPLEYSLEHPRDKSGYVSCMGNFTIDFGKNSMEFGPNGGYASIFQLYYTPIEANKLHMVIFTVSATDTGPITLIGANGAQQNVNITKGTNYISYIFKPTSKAQTSVLLQNQTVLLRIGKVTVELVQ